MLKISNVQVYGLEESIIASGYPKRLEFPVNMEEEISKLNNDFEQTSDFKRAVKLGNMPSGSGHCTYLSGIIVQFDIKYPMYFSVQLQRYHFIQIVSSSSKMHKLKDMDLEHSFNEYVDNDVIFDFKLYQNEYNHNPNSYNFMAMISNCPMGLEQNMRISTNFLQLKTIWEQRHNHKLDDWQNFCNWIITLPYFKELCLGEIK